MKSIRLKILAMLAIVAGGAMLSAIISPLRPAQGR